jgi:uncharacterized protein YfaS (alpha-2-macroglobulin family)
LVFVAESRKLRLFFTSSQSTLADYFLFISGEYVMAFVRFSMRVSARGLAGFAAFALTLGIITLGLSACGGDNDLQIIGKNFDGEIELQQNLTLEFSHPLAPDSLLDVWSATPYLKFTPDVKGSFKWTSPTTLIFSPSQGFQANADYRAELTDALLQNAGRREQKRVSLPSERTLSFHTPYLSLQNPEAIWVRAGEDRPTAGSATGGGEVELRIDAPFNYNVSPQQLAERLQVEAEGRVLPFSVRNAEPAKTISLAVKARKEDGGKALTLVVAKGLRCVESDRPTQEELRQTLVAPSAEEFRVTALTTAYDDDNPIVRISTSQSLFDANARPFVNVRPQPRNFAVEAVETGIIIRGAFQPDSAYQITVSKNLRGLFGGELGADYAQTVNFGAPEPAVKFTEAQAMYLSTLGGKNIGVRISGVAALDLIVEKVYENNILAFTRYGDKEYDGEYDESADEYHSWTDYRNVDDYGDPVLRKRIEVKTLPKVNGAYLLNLDFSDKLGAKGVYIVRAISTEQKWLRDSRMIVVSDVGVIAKASADAMFVAVHSIKTAEPLSSAEIAVISRNNQLIAKATTNKDGVAMLSNLAAKTPGSAPAMITATANGETSYLLLAGTRVETSRYEVGGLQENAAGLQAFIYGERDMYRPGETVRFNVVVRGGDWKPAARQPIKIKILLPNGKEYAALRRTLNDEGAAEASLTMPATALTGSYAAEIYTLNDVLLASQRFNVEEFLPDRISVSMNISAEQVRPGESLRVSATAMNLFGPPAANRNYLTEVYLKRKLFSAKGFERYNFALRRGGSGYSARSYYNENDEESTPIEPLTREGVTNPEGALSETFEISSAYKDIGLLQGSAFVTVFDENGRPVVRMKEFSVPTQEIFFGIRSVDRYQATRQAMQVGVVALDKNGKVANNVQASLRIIRHNWVTVLERDPYNSSRYRYVSQKQEITETERTITISGNSSSFSFTPRSSGEYEIRLAKPGAETFVSEYFYAFGWGDTQASSFEVSKEGEITIESEKTAYQTGETANLLFKTPFAGKLLVTVERGGVLDYYTLETDQKSARLSLKIKDEYTPNVYVGATLIKPLDNGAMPLTVAYGYCPLKVEQSGTRMPVSITLSERSRSKTKQTITVQTGESDAELTLAVVDEGILQLKNFQTPDPHGYFYQKRALQVASHSVYPLLFPELRAKSSPAGDAAMANRVNPFTNKRVKLIALWSGIQKASGGKYTYTFDVPEFSGALRVMAVAYKGASFGSAEKTMRIADPIVISSGLPRFLSPGDEALATVTLTNTTGREATAQISVATEGAISASVEGGQSVALAPNAEKQITMKVVAREGSMGAAAVTVQASALGEKFSERTDLTVRPTAGFVKYSGAGAIKSGEKQSFTLSGKFMEGSGRGRLVVSKSPIAQFTKNLTYLLRYPYGCVEQTVSSAFPQIYAAELSQSLRRSLGSSQSGGGAQEASFNVQEAVRKLSSMQLYNGSLSYWPGGAEESWFGSAYAAHFLAEAQKAGYDVNEEFLRRIQGYLAKKVKERNFEYYGYYDGVGQYRARTIPAKTIFYSLYVLALANKPDFATMNYYKANRDSLSLDSRYLLATAYFLAGDKSAYRSLLPKAFDGERAVRAFGGSFTSYVRDEAIALSAMMDVEPENPQIGQMTKHLSEQLKTARYLSTQENGMALVALGKAARRAAATDLQAAVSAGGQKIADFTGEDLILTGAGKETLAGKQISIVASGGQGTLYYFWETEGVSADGSFPEEDSYLQARRSFLSRSGQPINPDAIMQNDLVVVKLSLASLNKATVDNVVLTDMLPAGFEIENPRVGAVAELSWIRDNAEPQYIDIRDDRINIFTRADGVMRHYYYLARAVSKGSYRLGPVSADAMYNGEYHSYHGAGAIVIRERYAQQP